MNATRRIEREAAALRRRPCGEFLAYPCESNPFVWMFTMRGPQGTCYEQGVYHGKLLLPPNYPMAPPDVMLATPNGRFALDTRICLSEVTSFHPENWQPSWGVHTVIHALRGFMGAVENNGVGAIRVSHDERERLAVESRTWVSPEGARMADHLKLLDAAPPTADAAPVDGVRLRPVTPPPSTSTSTPAAAAAPTPAASPTPPATPHPETPPLAAPAPPIDPEGGRPPVAAAAAPPPAVPLAHALLPRAVWQINPSTLDHIAMALLFGILAILFNKYFACDLFA